MEGPNKEIREQKEPLRERLEKEVEAFLAAGGKIEAAGKQSFESIKKKYVKKNVSKKTQVAADWMQRKLDD